MRFTWELPPAAFRWPHIGVPLGGLARVRLKSSQNVQVAKKSEGRRASNKTMNNKQPVGVVGQPLPNCLANALPLEGPAPHALTAALPCTFTSRTSASTLAMYFSTSNLRLQPLKFMKRILPNTARSAQPWSWMPAMDHMQPT